jgi:hypothetical protein
VQTLKIGHFLKDSSPMRLCLCRVACADTPLRRHADTVVVFGCGSAALSLGVSFFLFRLGVELNPPLA